MSAKVLRRFIVLIIVLIVAVMVGTDLFQQWVKRPPGDYQTKLGTLRLEDKLYDQAMAYYDKALEIAPDHRGALMGRSLVYIKTKKHPEAIKALTYLIDRLEDRQKDGDETDRGVLASAYANRGIVHDRTGDYEKALANYVAALKVDEGAVEGPGVVHKILYGNYKISTVRERARYLYEQLQKPPSERLMRIPEIDALQRMHRP